MATPVTKRRAETLRHLWAKHPYRLGTGIAASVGVGLAVVLDVTLGSELQDRWPLVSDILATATGLAIPLFFGAALFDGWKATEDERKVRRRAAEKEMEDRREQIRQWSHILAVRS